jgi:hypothetical protein
MAAVSGRKTERLFTCFYRQKFNGANFNRLVDIYIRKYPYVCHNVSILSFIDYQCKVFYEKHFIFA